MVVPGLTTKLKVVPLMVTTKVFIVM